MADMTTESDARVSAVVEAAGAEIAKGLPNEQHRIMEALTNLDYFEGRNEQHIEIRPGEDPEDFARRPKRFLRVVTRVVELLTSHLYNPGPSRRFVHPDPVREWLERAYAGANAAMVDADQMATLNDVALVQVAATSKDEAPIKFHVWDSSQFNAWTHPDDATRPVAVATIDREDDRTRYTLWSADRIRYFRTEQAGGGRTEGGRVAAEYHREDNPYGVLPFLVVPYRRQRGQFWVDGPGSPVRKANGHVDSQLSDVAQAIWSHLFPIGVATNVKPGWGPTFRPGKFVNVPSDNTVLDGTITAQAKIGYVQATVQAGMAWEDATNYINNTLDMEGIPRAAFRLDQSGAVSGRAILAEQLPLIRRSEQRQPLAAGWEHDLLRLVLRVGGAWYGRDDLSAASKAPSLSLSWPPASLPMPGPDQDESDAWELDRELTSPVDVVMRRRGVGRDEAIDILRRVAKDKAEIKGGGGGDGR